MPGLPGSKQGRRPPTSTDRAGRETAPQRAPFPESWETLLSCPSNPKESVLQLESGGEGEGQRPVYAIHLASFGSQ